MVVIKDSIYFKSIFYVLIMIITFILGYLFLISGFNTKTKIRVDYETNSDVFYNVKYIDNGYISDNKYISSMIDYIDFVYNYNKVISDYVSGYYKYSVDSYLITYDDDITDSLWEKEYKILDDKVILLDDVDINSISIDDGFRIDFKKFRDEINQFNKNYNMDVNAYLHIRINILEFLNFNSFKNEYVDDKVIVINIPMTTDIFKINVLNVNNTDSYYEFSSDVPMNILFLIIGVFCLAFSLTFLIMVIIRFKYLYIKQSDYKKKLQGILSKYGDYIVRVKKFYVNKKYNMIYVDTFDDLMDVFNKKNRMITFKEVKRDYESIFVILDDNDAWIYKLTN